MEQRLSVISSSITSQLRSAVGNATHCEELPSDMSTVETLPVMEMIPAGEGLGIKISMVILYRWKVGALSRYHLSMQSVEHLLKIMPVPDATDSSDKT